MLQINANGALRLRLVRSPHWRPCYPDLVTKSPPCSNGDLGIKSQPASGPHPAQQRIIFLGNVGSASTEPAAGRPSHTCHRKIWWKPVAP